MLCHGSPYDEDEYVFNVHHAAQILALFEAPFILFGHTHLPAVFSIDEHRNVRGFAVRDEATVKLEPGLRYLINPGSVGQPRDRDARAAWLLIDFDAGRAAFRRVPYPIERTQDAIRDRGLPAALANRLAVGE